MAGKNLKIALQITADLNQARMSIQGLQNDLRRMNGGFEELRTTQTTISRSISNTNSNIQGLSSSFNQQNQVIRQLIASTAAYFSVNKLMNEADGYTSLHNRLKLVTAVQDDTARSQINLKNALEDTYKIAQSAAGEWGGVTAIYDKIYKNSERLKLSQKEVATVTETITKSISNSGSSAQAASAAMYQLGQSFDKGNLNGDEFVSISENAGYVLDVLAKGLGVTRAELRQMSTDGKLTTDVMVKAFTNMHEQVNQAFGSTQTTIGGGFTMVSNALKEYVGNSDQSIGATQGLVNALSIVANNFSDVVNVIGLAAWAAFTQKLVAQATVMKNQITLSQTNRAALLTEMQATVTATTAEVSRTHALMQLTQWKLADARADMARMTGMQRLTFMQQVVLPLERQLTAATAAHTTAKAAQTAATNTLTAATSRLALAGKALLGFFGGPVGLIITGLSVASMYLLMRDSSEGASESLENQKKSVSELVTEYKKLDETQQRIAMREAIKEVDDLSKAYKQQYLALTGVVRVVMNNSEVSKKDKDTVKQLYDEYVRGGITADQLATALNKLGTVNSELKKRIDDQSKSTTSAKESLDKQNLVIDVYTGKVDAAAVASNEFSNDLTHVGKSADNAATKVTSLGKAYTDYITKLNSTAVDNIMIKSLMETGLSEQEARMRQELLNTKNADPNANQTFFALTSKEINDIKNFISAEEDLKNITEQRKKEEEEITKAKEKQKKIAEQSQKINSTVIAQAKKYNYEGLEHQYGLPKGLLASISMQESGGNPNVVSPVGAKGAFQFMPATADRFGLKDRTNVAESAAAAAKYLSILLKMFNGDLNKAIMAYNAGEGNVQSGKAYGFKETQNYLPAVKRYMAGYNGLEDESAQATLQQIVTAHQDFLNSQNQNKLSIDMHFATDSQKLKAEYDALVDQIHNAGYDQSTLKTRLEQAEAEYQDKLTKRPEVLKRVLDSMTSLESSWLDAAGKDLEADLKNVEEKWKQPKADLAQLLMSEKDPIQAAEYESMLVKIDFVIEKEQITLQFNDAMKQLDELEALRKQRQETQKLKFEAGQISQPQFAESLNMIDAEMVPQLQTLAEQARILAEALGDAFGVEKLNAFVVGLTQIDTEFKKFLPTAEQLNERLAGGLTDAIIDFADGTKSAGDAFKQFASDFLREIAQMILKQMMFNMVKSIMPGSGGAGGAISSGLSAIFGFMNGGHTGYGRRDEVAGVVHRDEWVITKPRTNEPGAKEFLSYFERYGMEGLNKFNGYMNGGLVGAPTITAPTLPTPKLNNPIAEIAQSTSFNANQNFYLVDDPARILDTINSSKGQENLVVMMSRDPSKFKSALKIR